MCTKEAVLVEYDSSEDCIDAVGSSRLFIVNAELTCLRGWGGIGCR